MRKLRPRERSTNSHLHLKWPFTTHPHNRLSSFLFNQWGAESQKSQRAYGGDTACDRARTQTQAGLIPDLTPLGDFVLSSDFSEARREYWQLMSKIFVAVLIDRISLVMYKQSDFIFLNNCYQPYSVSLNPTSWQLKKKREGGKKTNLPYNSVFIPSDSFLVTFSICSCHFLIIKKCHCPIQRHLLHSFHEAQQQGWEYPAYEWLAAPPQRTECCPAP